MICQKCATRKHRHCEAPATCPCQHKTKAETEPRKLKTMDERTMRQISLRIGDPRDC